MGADCGPVAVFLCSPGEPGRVLSAQRACCRALHTRAVFGNRGRPRQRPLIGPLFLQAGRLWRGVVVAIALYGDAPRFLRASVAVAVIALAAAALHLLASATTQSGVAGGDALTRAAEIVAQSPQARANLALLRDKRILFHPAGDGFVMFGIVRRSWVVLGDPIGPFARWRDLLCQLINDATSQGGWPVFFGVGEAAAKICSKIGFAVRRIGDQAILP